MNEVLMTYDPENIFAKILQDDIPCDRVYEDQYVLAFNDINPKAKIHVLVIPKGAYTNYGTFCQMAPEDEVLGFFRAIANLVKTLGVEDQGYRLISNCKTYGGQEVDHFHIHILGGQPMGPMVSVGSLRERKTSKAPPLF